MRITGGFLGGRLLRVPATGTRPTQDRVRAAVFSALAAYIPGARVLDLFAGSGAMGLEAYSRGAAAVCWVERERRALAVLRHNIQQLCPAPAGGPAPLCVIAADALRFARAPTYPGPFDVVFADPPYDADGAWQRKTLSALAAGSILAPSSLVVLEAAARTPLPEMPGWRLVRTRRYGESSIRLWRRAPLREEPVQ